VQGGSPGSGSSASCCKVSPIFFLLVMFLSYSPEIFSRHPSESATDLDPEFLPVSDPGPLLTGCYGLMLHLNTTGSGKILNHQVLLMFELD
jgi:hypothetical protein